ncbi:hypothetical protein E2562_031340 [Oryza meyeriana var. granulata]|uniref:F-box domain-containing protein n=1 Tax=Oryza meyeriana var. granulata TaxID=110450 RepID=A0A6G1D9W1_9ORYZ|nr:hypothetical protein E2562_031340 [Oryza meyeriana var. granulata]KAF0909082.1 hypothetical protein E2562_031340 [Oryza meyeriana var. granulata]
MSGFLPATAISKGGEAMDLAPSLLDDVLVAVLRRLPLRLQGVAPRRGRPPPGARGPPPALTLRHPPQPRRLMVHAVPLPPTTGTAVSCRLDYTVPLPPREPDAVMPPIYVKDHCNGLLLLHHCVVNPTTPQWEPLPSRPTPPPQPPPPGMGYRQDEYLVFGPTLSPNYELSIVPDVPFKPDDDDEECEERKWPPSTMILPVFSSKTEYHRRTISIE